MSDTKKIYLNNPQMDVYHVAAHTTCLVMGRRGGKTHGVAAPWWLRNVLHMPQSAMGIVTPTFKMALTQTLPGTFDAMNSLGYIRDVHYVVGTKPPSHFKKPVREPFNYDRVVSWFNGSIQYLISQDIPGTSNSFTLQSIFIDEAKYVNFDKLKDETLPANGGFKGPWKDSPWLNSMLILSDMPTSKKAGWFLGYREKATPEVIEAIRWCLSEIYKFSNREQNEYSQKRLIKLRKQLAALRQVAVYYRELSSVENVILLGENYIRQMKRDLPPLVFQTSIMCVRPTKLKDGFYPSLGDQHLYTAFDNSYLSNVGYNFEKAKQETCLADADLKKDEPICIAMDYNSNINWIVAGQDDGMKINVLKSFYVKYDRKIREVVDDFCQYYRHTHCKEVVYYYDTTALGSNYAVNDDDFAAVVCQQFAKNGWQVTPVNIGTPMRHNMKHIIIDQALKGQKYKYPQINEPNNESLIVAMRMAGVRIGPKGWEKDKTGEKYAESEQDRLEHRTDGTDGFDTLMIGMNFYPQTGGLSYVGEMTII
jgi:hypothetical protein